MESTIQEVVAILDRSGSMNGKEEDTLGGINAAFEQLKTEQEANTTIKVSVKLFDHEEQLLFRSIDLKDVRPIERRQYIPRGATALLDALGNSINYFITKKLQDLNAYGSCVIYVVTDGIENSSKTYNTEKIKLLIAEAEKEYNIKIIYLAANQDAILEASKYGISTDSALNYSENSQNVESAHRSLASAVKRVRTGEYSGFTNIERRSASQVSEPPPVTRQRY